MAAVGVASLILAPIVAVTPAWAQTTDGEIFISEIHYDNVGTDVGEAIEVEAPVGTDLTGWQIYLYNGNGGGVYQPTRTLDGVVPEAGVVVEEYPSNGIQNGEPDGIALVDADDNVVEFLSYGGTFTAVGGPADGVDSTDIGITQPGSTPIGQSLQLIGGEWVGPLQNTFGELNPDEVPGPGEPTELSIAEIQGTGDATEYSGQAVTTEGVVTAVYPEGNFDGAYIQTPGTGADLEGHDASHGIFVYGDGSDFADSVSIGDYVQVTGTAGEYFTLTQITVGSYEVLDDDVAAPVPAQITWPETDAERELYEGMLVMPQGEYTVTDTYPTNRYGSIGLAAGEEPLRQPTDVAVPGSDEAARVAADNAARAVTLDDGSSWDYTNWDHDNHETPIPYLSLEDAVRVGADVTFTDPVIVDYRFQWNFQPTTQVTGDNGAAPATFENTRAEAPAEVGGDVSLAVFNVLNYFTSLGDAEDNCAYFPDRAGAPTTTDFCTARGAYDQENLDRQEIKIVNAIIGLDADVVALQEIENSIGFVDGDAAEDRDHALSALVDALNSVAGDGEWDYVESAPAFPEDEDVIRNAFIYQTGAVAPVGETEILLDDENFSNAREPMAQEFAAVDDAGEVIEGSDTFVVINNHFKSKSSGGSSGDNVDEGDGQGAYNGDRQRQAQSLVDFADEVSGEAGSELVFLVGDFNSYTMEDPMRVFYDEGYVNIGQDETDKSTYSFGGMVGSLDHILGSSAAAEVVTGADIWNINAYEAIGLEYSRYNYNVTDLYDESAYRSSDHDPIIVGIDLVDEPDPTTVDVNLLAINDFHGRLFDYNTDDDDNITGNDTLAFAGTIEELRAEEGEENTIFFSSGDNIGASLFTSSLQEDKPTIDILNALDLNAATVGNHEFDGGWDNLSGQVTDWADFPHLGANVYLREGGEPALPEYATFEVDGVTVAVIGVVTEETATLVSPGGIEDLEFGDPVEAVNRVAGELSDGDGENGEADVIVASFHEGVRSVTEESTLEEKVDESAVFASIVNETSAEVDAIFNAHTHQLYSWDGPVPGEDGELRPVIQGASYGAQVSQVVLTVDRESGDVVQYSHRNVGISETPMDELIDTYPRVAEVQTILDAALAEAEVQGSVVVGEVTADVTTAFVGDQRDDRGSESTLGNLVGNMLRDTLSTEQYGSAEIGVTNPGGLRAELFYEASGDEEDGEVTFAEANAVLPFLNDLWTLTLTGEQFVTMLEQQWGTTRDYLQLGLSDNVSYTYDPEAEAGERITSVTIDGEPLDPDAEYRIGTFSFLAQGGDSFTVFQDATDVQPTGLIDRDGWMAYIGENSPLSPDFARHATVVTPLPSELVAGDEVSFEVSLLDLTSLGSPANTELAVYLVGDDGERGEAVHTADVSDGAATVTFTVPDDLDGEYTLEMEAAPSGTTIQVPVNVEADEEPPPSTRQYGFFLTNGWDGGPADHAFMYGRYTDEVLIGDWDGDGTDSIVVRREDRFFVSNAPQGGPAESVFSYGRPDDTVLVGDWDGDGFDTLAVRRGHTYFVKNSLTGGNADEVFAYGRADDHVLVGDWDGDTLDTFAVRRGDQYYVKNTLEGGHADHEFAYGRATDEVYAGDWDGDATDTLAVRRGKTFYVKNSLTGGPADMVMAYGREGDEVYVGDWDGDGTDTIGLRRLPPDVD